MSPAAGHEPRTLERYTWPGGSNRELPDASTLVTMQLSCPSVWPWTVTVLVTTTALLQGIQQLCNVCINRSVLAAVMASKTCMDMSCCNNRFNTLEFHCYCMSSVHVASQDFSVLLVAVSRVFISAELRGSCSFVECTVCSCGQCKQTCVILFSGKRTRRTWRFVQWLSDHQLVKSDSAASKQWSWLIDWLIDW